jgi:prepilin-type processing-associated H-X9-DG protein
LNQGQVLDRQGERTRQLGYETIAPLLEKTRGFALSLDVDRGLQADLVATVGSPDDLKDVAETLRALLTLGKNAAPSLKRNLGDRQGIAGEFSEWAHGLLASAIENSALETAGQAVHLRSIAPIDMAEASRLLMSFLTTARADTQRQQSVNHLKQIGLAFHNYHSVNDHFPPPVLYGGKSGRVPYSWRVAILPYLEAQPLYSQYNFDEPWDGPNNRRLIDHMPAVYGYPGAGLKPGHTAYFVFTGPEAALGKGDRPTVADILDGTSNTILAVEARREVPWTKPEDIPFDSHVAPPELGGFTPYGFNVLFGDGSVRLIKKSVDPSVLKALITRAGREVLSTDSF